MRALGGSTTSAKENMSKDFSKKGRLAYGAFQLVLSIYILTADSFTFRGTKFDGLELYILGAACFFGFIDMTLAAIYNYDSKNPNHPYRWYHYTLIVISMTLIVLAVGFTFLEEEIFDLPDEY